jgi:capsular exopolysaccharide synthesis family protein
MSRNFNMMQEAELELNGRTRVIADRPRVVPHTGTATHAQEQHIEIDDIAREECVKLVQRIFLAPTEKPRQVIVFAGVDRGDGCSTICLNTAKVLAANTSKSICIVEANFRTPSLPMTLGVANHYGLADSLQKSGDIRTFANQLKPANLWLLSGGAVTSDSFGLLNSDALAGRVQELRNEFDFILIDTPAIGPYADAIALGRVSDGVVVVLQAEATRRESALKGIENLRQANIEILGAVLNQRTFPIPNFVYHRL